MPHARSSGYDNVWFPTRIGVYIRDDWKCLCCGAGAHEQTDGLSVDHYVPSSKGGSNRANNLLTLCRECNSKRGTTPWRKWRPDLLRLVRAQLRKRIDCAAARTIAQRLRPERVCRKR